MPRSLRPGPIPLLLASLGLGLIGLRAAEEAPKPRLADAAPVEQSPAVQLDHRIIDEVKARAELSQNLRHLCDEIGPRVTGSPALEKANRWAEEKMKAYGLTNVKLEPWEIPVAWQRNTCAIKLIEPHAKPLIAASAAWSPSTAGKLTGPVVVLEAKTKDDLAKYKGRLKNAIVLRGAPVEVKPITDLTYISPTPKKVEPKKEEPRKDDAKPMEIPQPTPRPTTSDLEAFRKSVGEFLKSEGAACIAVDSAKPHGLLIMTGRWQEGDRAATQANELMPTVFMAHEHYRLLHRLATATGGTPPKVEVEISNTFTPGPVTVFNTVGEIAGSEKPDEFVVIGAHLDSWDLGSGATDNGTGSSIVLECARTLAKLAKEGQRPKRTIRFVLFTGEEQGLHGSKAYVKRHEAEMPKTSMALVHDTGTGKVIGFNLMGREAVKKVLDEELATLKTIDGWKEATTRSAGGTDHLPFDGVNVPGFSCQQEMDEYRLTHHTQTDTFDHVKIPNLVQGAQVISITAMRVANLPALLPREKPEPKKDKKDEKKDGTKEEKKP
jgi:hypothetical protein